MSSKQIDDAIEALSKMKEERKLKELAERYFKNDLKVWPGDAIMIAAFGKCQGACCHHEGHLKVCRIIDPLRPFDWGWYVYCDTAISDDKNNGLVVLELSEYGKLLSSI